MELRQYWSIVWKWMWLIVLSTGIAGVSSYVATSQSPRIYQASTTLLIGQSIQNLNANAQDIYTSQQLALTYVQIVRTEAVLQGAIDALGLKMSPDQLRGTVNASIVQGTQLIDLKVVDTNPARAQAVANEIAHQLILQGPAADKDEAGRREFVQKQVDDLQNKIQDAQKQIADQLSSIQVTASAREIADKQNQITALQVQMNQWQITYASLLTFLAPKSPNYLSVVEPARLPTSPIAPNVMMSVLVAAAIGLTLAVGGAFLIEYIDDTLKSPDDVEQSLKLSALGLIARIAGTNPEDKVVTVRHPRASHSEAYRVLRTNIQVADVDRPIKTLLVTSPNPVEGKSLTAANLAVVMAQAGLRTVLIDADLRRPSQHRLFGVTNDFGLTNSLVQQDLTSDGYMHLTEVENLRLVTSGQIPPNPTELLGSKRMQKLIQMLRDQADMIILDSPPCLPLADAAVLARQVDGVLLVVDAGNTRRDSATKAKEALERAGGRVLGVALNRVSARGSGYYYYYYYYYSSDGQRKRRSSGGLPSRLRGLLSQSNHSETSAPNEE
jgi:non-specific protein-tyrosine kinase